MTMKMKKLSLACGKKQKHVNLNQCVYGRKEEKKAKAGVAKAGMLLAGKTRAWQHANMPYVHWARKH